MIAEVVKINKPTLVFGDLVLLYENYIAQLNTGKVPSFLSNQGYWVRYSGSPDGSFYDAEKVEALQTIELRIEGNLLVDDCLYEYLQRLFIHQIEIDTEVEAKFENGIVTEISFPTSLLFTPREGETISDMYMGGIGNLEHIGVEGIIKHVADDYFVVVAKRWDVEDVKVNKSSWHWFS